MDKSAQDRVGEDPSGQTTASNRRLPKGAKEDGRKLLIMLLTREGGDLRRVEDFGDRGHILEKRFCHQRSKRHDGEKGPGWPEEIASIDFTN